MSKKKIISFALWGDNDGYCQGAIENAERAPKFYPGWVCRFYVDNKVPQKYIDKLKELGSEIIYKGESKGFLGLYWRFEPMFDDATIDRFIVRDTDSRINEREAQAVREWEATNFPFHIIRDNNEHNIHILGGTWGAKAGCIPHFKMLMDQFIQRVQPDPKNPRGDFHGSDQIFLSTFIWPYIEKCHLAHDNYFKYTGYEKPLTVELNREGYVGMVYSIENADRVEVKNV